LFTRLMMMQSLASVGVAAWLAGPRAPHSWGNVCIGALLAVIPLGLLLYGTSVTRERAAIEKRNRAQWAKLLRAGRAARQASTAKSAFLASMSHEIRTPMTAILGYAELLLDPRLSENDRREGMLTIRRNCEHLLSVVNDILDISKIEAGQMTVERISCSPRLILEQVCSLMNVRAASKGLMLEKHIEGSLPAGVRTDPTRLRQILLNIVGNAVKFTESGGVHIRVEYVPGAEQLRFDVSDTGIGIAAEQMAGLFKAYSQAEVSTARRFGGTGLGLSISKRLATLLGGDITVRSEAGKGSTFSVVILAEAVPGAAEESAEFVIPECVAKATSMPPSLVGSRILLAEDGVDNQRLISFHLRKAGAQVEIAPNGAAAIERANVGRTGPDVILMDMQMPEMDGYEATQRLRAAGCTTPVIALTAHAMGGDRERCIAAGCDDYLGKPIDRSKLLEVCARWLAVAKANRGHAASRKGG
jgi:signal transduction histidine kinase/CheY-like chemotaxis protein